MSKDKSDAPKAENVAPAEPSPVLPTFFAKLRHSACPTAFVKVSAVTEDDARRRILAHWPGASVAFCDEPASRAARGNITAI